MAKSLQKWFAASVFIFIIMLLLLSIEERKVYYQTPVNVVNLKNDYGTHGKWRNLNNNQIKKLSKLGQILYLENTPPIVLNESVRTYKILIWKHGRYLENRHIKRYTDKRFDPFQHCSARNCEITYRDDDITTADLVLFHLHRTKSAKDLPTKKRNSKQIWTFLTDESPFHTFLYTTNNVISDYDGLFNWSMTYRMDSDIPVPYGRTMELVKEVEDDEELFEIWNESKKQDVLVSIMGSNCNAQNHRWNYVKELQKHIDVDVYGQCGTLKCPGHFETDCSKLSEYKFYLAFENSNCDEYVTEKLWWNGFAKNAIPIVMGGSKVSYRQLLPPKSYINVEEFAYPRDLANFINYLNETPTEMRKYLMWKKKFKIINEHGYFQSTSVHYCRICEALNYNSKAPKVYKKLNDFWNKKQCYPSWDS